MSAVPATGVERVEWSEFFEAWEWNQGEHVTLVGPNGAGKTTLMREILRRRQYTAFLACKVKDPMFNRLRDEDGFRVIREWPPEAQIMRGRPYRCLLWPKGRSMEEFERAQYKEFSHALEDVFRVGGWTLALDELRYMSEHLGLTDPLKVLYQQGRSLNITIVGGMQRPRYVPLEAFNQAKHLFLWRDPDRGNYERLSEIAGAADPKALGRELLSLGRHEVLYVDGWTGNAIRTEVTL